MNRKRIYRLYREEGLSVRKRRRKCVTRGRALRGRAVGGVGAAGLAGARVVAVLKRFERQRGALPQQSGFIESFTSRLGDGCLNAYWFLFLGLSL